jgi:hypothetical protein
MFSYRNPKPIIDSDDDDSSTISDPSTIAGSPVETETEIGMAITSTANAPKEAPRAPRKEIRMPTPFSGKREDLRTFLQETTYYMMAFEECYRNDRDKIFFVLSHMIDGDAKTWKQEFFETKEQEAAQNNTPINLGTYKALTDAITKDFSPFDVPKDAIHEMKELRMNNGKIEEHIARFKMLVTKSKLVKNEAVIEYFRETLPYSLQKEIMRLAEPPKTLDDWYKWANQLQNNYERMKVTFSKRPNKGDTPIPVNQRKPTDKRPRQFYFDQSQKDPNAMDVNAMATDKRNDIMRNVLCYECKKPGHISRFCPDKGQNNNKTPSPQVPKKMKGKELYSHIRALMAEMKQEDVEEFFETAKEGF